MWRACNAGKDRCLTQGVCIRQMVGYFLLVPLACSPFFQEIMLPCTAFIHVMLICASSRPACYLDMHCPELRRAVLPGLLSPSNRQGMAPMHQSPLFPWPQTWHPPKEGEALWQKAGRASLSLCWHSECPFDCFSSS